MRLSASACLPARLSACNNSNNTERIFVKSHTRLFQQAEIPGKTERIFLTEEVSEWEIPSRRTATWGITMQPRNYAGKISGMTSSPSQTTALQPVHRKNKGEIPSNTPEILRFATTILTVLNLTRVLKSKRRRFSVNINCSLTFVNY
jgi:hypothetical protein